MPLNAQLAIIVHLSKIIKFIQLTNMLVMLVPTIHGLRKYSKLNALIVMQDTTVTQLH